MRIMKLLGSLFFAAYLIVGLVQSAHAADPGYFIRCVEYTSARGHMLRLRSYVAYWDLEAIYPTDSACDAAAGSWVDTHYHGNVLPDGSRALVQCWCERVQQ